jgi:hypothetical protein
MKARNWSAYNTRNAALILTPDMFVWNKIQHAVSFISEPTMTVNKLTPQIKVVESRPLYFLNQLQSKTKARHQLFTKNKPAAVR